MANSCWRRRFRRAIPVSVVVGLLAVPSAALITAVKRARDAAYASVTT